MNSVISHINPITRITLLSVLGVLFSALPKSAAAQCGTTPATGSITWTTNWCDEFNDAANSPISSANCTYDPCVAAVGQNSLQISFAPPPQTSPCCPTD